MASLGKGKALVIGAGVGGMAAAIALEREGYDYEIFERSDVIGTGGTGLTLWPNAIRALGKLGLDTAVLTHGDPLELGEIKSWRGTDLTSVDLAEIGRRSGCPLICIRRSDLYGELLSKIDRERVRPGVQCTGYRHVGDNGRARVVAEFDDGSEAEGTILVAADGIRSKLRGQLLHSDPLRYVGWMTWRGVGQLPEGLFPPGRYREFFGRGSRFGLFAIKDRYVYWYGTLNAEVHDRAAIDPLHKGEACAHFADWPEPAVAAIECTATENLVRTGVYDTEALPRWSDGQMALLGDAAHPMTPDLGQGACQAIEDALCLAASLRNGHDPPDGLKRYEAAGLARTKGLVERSRRVGKIRQWQHPLLYGLRTAVMRAIPPSALLKLFESD